MKAQPQRKWLATLAIFFLPLFLLTMQCSRNVEVGKRQIILISIDTLRGDHITPYGYVRDTSPHLADLVEDSVYYSNAYTNGCWTHPSHMSILTGTLPSRHGINQPLETIEGKKYQKLNESLQNIAQVLQSCGVETVKFAKLPNALGFGNGFDINNVVDPLQADWAFEWLLQELENHKDKEFFFFIHTWKVHAPYQSSYYLAKERLSEEILYYMANPHKLPHTGPRLAIRYGSFLKENNLMHVRDCVDMYDGGIRYVDDYMGRLIDKTKQLGIYSDLMIVVLSDHGEHFAEHNGMPFYNWHGKDYYEEYIKVPLIIKYPQQAVKVEKRKEAVSLIDVMPTILDCYDVAIPEFVQGDSLLIPSAKRKNYIVSEAVSQSTDELKMIRIDNMKYIVTMPNPYNRERVNWDTITNRRLFDLTKDPSEMQNLYNDAKYAGHGVHLEKKLKGILTESSIVDRTTGEITLDQETLDQMQALGYL
jgi:arylsulfatase A-like enzyme